jgi:hypothetical protein
MSRLVTRPFGHPAFVRCTDYPINLLGEYPSYEALKEAISAYLVGLAKVGSSRTPQEMLVSLNIPLTVADSYHLELIDQVVSEINGDQYIKRKPLVGALLYGYEEGHIANTGFYSLMDYPEFCLGMPFNKADETHRAAFFGVHARACWKYWSGKRKYQERKAA